MHERRRPCSRGSRLAGAGLVSAAVLLTGCERSVVSPVEISEVEIVPAEITITAGAHQTAVAILKESGGAELPGRTVTWTAEDSTIAAVTADGVVEGRASGTTRIHASSEGVTGSAEVTVVAEPDSGCDVRNALFSDDLDIPRDTRCTLTNVTVEGNVRLRKGARLTASDLTVHGNLEGDEAELLILDVSHIYGNLKFEDGGSVELYDTDIGGKLDIDENRGHIDIRDSAIDGDVRLDDNRGGPFTLYRNRVAGDLECKNNRPSPTGGENVVDGEKKRQCQRL